MKDFITRSRLVFCVAQYLSGIVFSANQVLVHFKKNIVASANVFCLHYDSIYIFHYVPLAEALASGKLCW